MLNPTKIPVYMEYGTQPGTLIRRLKNTSICYTIESTVIGCDLPRL